MPSYYTMNLGFETTDPTLTQNGEFVGPPQSGTTLAALQQSKVWLKSQVEPTDPNAKFEILPDKNILLSKDDTVYVRLFCATVSQPSGLTARITVVFGRKHNQQNYRTPFTFADRNTAHAVFPGDSGTSPNFGTSWLIKLGAIANAPTVPNSPPYEFSFIVGGTVWVESLIYTFGHDPEMNVGMGVGEPSAKVIARGT